MKIAEVKFKTTGKIHPCLPKNLELNLNDLVLVLADQALELGTVLNFKEMKRSDLTEPVFPILRKVTEEDERKLEGLKKEARKLIPFCQEKAEELGLKMKIIEADFSLDEKKLTFYFTAGERVDFRELLPILVSRFHKLIRLQQIGPKDEAKILGGIGPCGRPLCCQLFLKELESVTMEEVRAQDLVSLGSSKISGLCGKLLCCLAFEADLYRKLKEKLPKLGSRIQTKEGKGEVISQNVLKQSVLVKLPDERKIEVKYG